MAARLAGILLVLSLAAMTPDQHAPPGASSPGGTPEAAHHAWLQQERQALERGEGFGMALAADRNGYPGPRHVLELGDQLKLSPQQRARVQELFTRMRQQALARGKEVLLAESQLDREFAQNRPEAELRAQVNRVAALRADLRWIHLSAHLATRPLLTQEQLAAYQHLRHTAAAEAPSSK